LRIGALRSFQHVVEPIVRDEANSASLASSRDRDHGDLEIGVLQTGAPFDASARVKNGSEVRNM